MMRRLTDEQMSEIYARCAQYGLDTHETPRGYQLIQIELQLRTIEEIRKASPNIE